MKGTFISDTTRRVSNGTFRLYMLRHQLSMDLLLENTDPRTIQELMGHKKVEITIEYARSDEDAKVKAITERNLY